MADAGIIEYEELLGWRVDSCKSGRYFGDILRIRQPKYQTGRERIRHLDKIFYPISDVQKILSQQHVLEEIVSCNACEGCRKFPGPNGHRLEEEQIIRSIKDERKPRFMLLAILICM